MDDVVLVAHRAHVAGVDLLVVAEQAVAVLHQVRGLGAVDRGHTDVAHERRVDGAVLRWERVGVVGRIVERLAGPTIAGEVVGHRVRALDL